MELFLSKLILFGGIALQEHNLTLTEMISVDILQQLQDAFAEMTGIAALTTDKNGVAVTKGSNFTDFCTKYIRASAKGCKRCGECDKMGAHMTIEKGKSCAYYCHAGLVDFAAPIIANGEMIGSFIGGQVLTTPPDLEKFKRIAEDLEIDSDKLVESVKSIQIVEKQFIDKVARFLSVIASVLSNIAYNRYQLYQSNIEIEKSAQAKSDFLANMSHEIRTPMNAVLGMAEMALREEMSPTAREYIHQIKFSGKNLLVIINDILDFSKIESGKMDIVPVTYDSLSVTNDLASIVCSRISDKDIEFIMDISPEIPTRLYGDNVRIQQALVNLLNNAVKFTNRGRVYLRLECEEKNDGLIMLKACVSDTGRGIKKEDLGRLFKSFQQLDSRRNRNIEGTGLGLAITKQLLELMGGSITVESEYEKGTTFYFEVPQKKVDEPTPPKLTKPISVSLMIDNIYVKEQIIRDLNRIGIKYIDAMESSANNAEIDFFITEKQFFTDKIRDYFVDSTHTRCIVIDSFNSTSNFDIPQVSIIRKPVYFLNLYAALGIIDEYTRESDYYSSDFNFIAPEANILIVDDNATNLVVAKGLIEPIKMKVETAASAAETIQKVSEKTYDLIFMDHMMPETDGIETTHIIRRMLPQYSSVPIIALTANALEGMREMFIREGMNDFVAKPIDIKDITAKLRKWLPQEKIIPVEKSDTPAAENSENGHLNIKELNIKNAISLLGSESLLRNVLKEYYSLIDKKSALIEQHLQREEWRDYTIEVHALKSTSRQIGADELSALAAELEKAGNEKNIDFINEKNPELLKQYRHFKDILGPYFPECAKDQNAKPAKPEEIICMLDELKSALEEFDTLAIDEAVEKMSTFEYEENFARLFNQLKTAAEECDVDLCAEIEAKWREQLQ